MTKCPTENLKREDADPGLWFQQVQPIFALPFILGPSMAANSIWQTVAGTMALVGEMLAAQVWGPQLWFPASLQKLYTVMHTYNLNVG